MTRTLGWGKAGLGRWDDDDKSVECDNWRCRHWGNWSRINQPAILARAEPRTSAALAGRNPNGNWPALGTPPVCLGSHKFLASFRPTSPEPLQFPLFPPVPQIVLLPAPQPFRPTQPAPTAHALHPPAARVGTGWRTHASHCSVSSCRPTSVLLTRNGRMDGLHVAEGQPTGLRDEKRRRRSPAGFRIAPALAREDGLGECRPPGFLRGLSGLSPGSLRAFSGVSAALSLARKDGPASPAAGTCEDL
eukprot:gene13084-biopygen12077